jgi:hypothetical protein
VDRDEVHQVGLRPTQHAFPLEPSETARHRLEEDGDRATPVGDFDGLAGSHPSQDRACLTP